ncbi:hypothetical protein [Neisseria wadsworthii]|uniref:hypothetical protein n=1 Tax=Neisseria wadsworthii TaxID=607711 RepID=UPI000D3011BD|nr:hypothetical protein [Neisseria wadsworthii]
MTKDKITSQDTDSKTRLRWKRKWQAWFFFIALSSWNGLMLWVVWRQFPIVYGDGPAGFVEFLVNYSIFLIAISTFISVLVFIYISWSAFPETRHLKLILAMTLFLSFWAFVMIDKACSNTVGFCQKWRLIW